jgi:hypothetical protein
MRRTSKAMLGASVTGVLAVGLLGGVAATRHAAGAPYELLSAGSADAAAAEAVTLTEGREDDPRLRAGLRRMLVGVHGEATVRARGGGFATYAWQRGSVSTASATSVTVRSADGMSWTWAVNSDTKVRKNGAKSTGSALTSGDTVFVVGRPGDTARTAQGVVVPKRTTK